MYNVLQCGPWQHGEYYYNTCHQRPIHCDVIPSCINPRDFKKRIWSRYYIYTFSVREQRSLIPKCSNYNFEMEYIIYILYYILTYVLQYDALWILIDPSKLPHEYANKWWLFTTTYLYEMHLKLFMSHQNTLVSSYI